MLKVRRDAALEIERVYRGHCGRLVAKEEKTQIVFRWIWDGPGQSVEVSQRREGGREGGSGTHGWMDDIPSCMCVCVCVCSWLATSPTCHGKTV